MKPKSIKSLLALALLAPGVLFAQTTAKTTPVGYVTSELSVGFNLWGQTLVSPLATAGSFSAEASGVLTSSVDFVAALGASGSSLVSIEITSGANAGAVLESNEWTTNTITAEGADSSFVGASFKVRKVQTLEQVFGTSLVEDFSAAGADVVWVPNGTGGYDQFYRQTDLFGGPAIWHKVDEAGDVPSSNTPLHYLDGVFVEVKAAAVTLVTSGEVLTGSVSNSLLASPSFTPVSIPFAAGSTLATVNLSGLTDDFSAAGADVLWVPTGVGAYSTYYKQTDLFGGPAVWANTSDDSVVADPATVVVAGGAFIENKGGVKNTTFAAPTFYSTL